MGSFPRTVVGGLSVSRMIIGTNWFLGYSHTTSSKDALIRDTLPTPQKIADIMEVYFRAGVDTIMAPSSQLIADAIKETEDRTGTRGIYVATPAFPVTPRTPVDGFDPAEADRIIDECVRLKAAFCLPHTSTTDMMVDKCTREIRQFPPLCRKIREHGLIPGLSTHMPEAIIYADESGLDVDTYVSLYNSMGFLMQVEVDWLASIIRNAKKPVMTIKPFAAGQLRPFQALHFVWNSLRDQDMVTVGTMTPREAAEVIELSLGILEKRHANVDLQETRSKKSVKPKKA
jgi:hypothetical protein